MFYRIKGTRFCLNSQEIVKRASAPTAVPTIATSAALGQNRPKTGEESDGECLPRT